MSNVYWYGNRYVSQEEVLISPEDRGYYFGDGAYEVFRFYSGRLYETDAHLKRLWHTAAGLRLTLPFTEAELTSRLEELVRRSGAADGNVYLQITRGAAPRAHPFPKGAEPVVMAYASSVDRPLAAMETGIRAVAVEDIRWLRCDYKTLNLLPNVMAKQEALDRGADEAVLHRDGTVTECSASNLMIVKDGTVRTHPANRFILHGVTRAVVLRLARAAEIPVLEQPFTLDELASADEIFITGTTVEVTPVVALNGQAVGSGKPGPVTRRLQQQFAATLPS
ncbi:D-amino-acid transaminase [Cohnella zeiphila]|uniref:D-alanine aminotransferase n=1 Tax=Cohnella zeiphila TaxID=2761120 RepID=A0A7X0SIZ6_9BACL|nr:D-amino-acid transaminase [Cohnella zeiphila]